MATTATGRRPGEVVLCHVRSHTLVPGNEAADWLAERERQSRTQHEGDVVARRTTDWLQRWLARRAGIDGEGEGAGGE